MGKFSFWNMRTAKYLLAVIVFLSYLNLRAQEIYFDQVGKRLGEKGVSFFYQKKPVDSLLAVDTILLLYSKDNSLYGREIVKRGKPDGPFIYYYENGKVKERGLYLSGLRVGYAFQYYENGNPRSTLYYPKKRGQVNDFKEYDFLIINYWSPEGEQLVNNGNGYCKCSFDYKSINSISLTSQLDRTTSIVNPEDYYHDANGLKYSLNENGKVKDGLRDSVWLLHNNEGILLHKETFVNGNFKVGESYKDGKIYKYNKLIFTFLDDTNCKFYFYKSVADNMKYPSGARARGIQGEVLVEFQIDENGKVAEFKILKGVGGGYNEGAIRAIKASEATLVVSKKRGLPIRTKFVMPVIIKVD